MTRVIVLHVAENWGASVRAGVLQHVAATPELEHHLLRGMRGSESTTDHGTGFASVGILPARARFARRAIRRTVAAIAPDVVHAHSTYAGVFVRTALRTRPERRLVYSPHCFAFARRDLSPVVRMLARFVERTLAANTDTFAVCSHGEARMAAGLTGRRFSSRPAARVIHVPPVAVIPALAMMEYRDPNRVVAVGRLDKQGDPDFYRATVLHLRRNGRPGLDADWIGDGEDFLARARLERCGVQVSGRLSSFDAQCALGRAGVYVHSARWDGFPLAILEALELGVPVIARDVPSFAGVTATPGATTPQGVATRVEELLRGGEQARQRNLEAWQLVMQGNNLETQRAAVRTAYTGGDRQPAHVAAGRPGVRASRGRGYLYGPAPTLGAGLNPSVNPEQP